MPKRSTSRGRKTRKTTRTTRRKTTKTSRRRTTTRRGKTKRQSRATRKSARGGLSANKRHAHKRRYHGRGTVKTKSIFKRTSKGGTRISARAFYNAGGRLGSVHCYDGKCKYLRLRRNGSPYWAVS